MKLMSLRVVFPLVLLAHIAIRFAFSPSYNYQGQMDDFTSNDGPGLTQVEYNQPASQPVSMLRAVEH